MMYLKYCIDVVLMRLTTCDYSPFLHTFEEVEFLYMFF